MRRNPEQQPCPSDEGGDTLEYVYDEVFFRTNAKKKEITEDPDTFWELGSGWLPEVKLTPEERREKKIAELAEKLEEAKAELEGAKKESEMELAELEKKLSGAKEDLEQARTDNDMAIAELTIVLASMMSPAE